MSAAAAAPAGSKKRKTTVGEAADDESVVPSRLHGVTSGREEVDAVVEQAAGCMDGLRGVFKTAVAAAEGEIEQLAAEINQLFIANGGTVEPHKTSGKLKLNVGGTVFFISVQRLLQPKMKLTYLSTLLLHFIDALPKDTNNLPFLEAHPPYFHWLRDQLALLESPHLDEISLHSPEADDPSYSEYHSLFMQKVVGDIEMEEQPRAPGSSAAASANGGGGGEQRDVEMADGSGQEGQREGADGDGGVKRVFRQIDRHMRRYESLLEGLQKQKKAMEAFLAAMRPFVNRDSSGEDLEVMTLSVSDEEVSVLRRTIVLLGQDHVLVTRFDRASVLQLIVDFARRLTVVMPPGQFVHPPVVAPHEKAIFAVELDMYGLDTVPPVGEAAGASAVIKTADEWLAVMEMTDKKIATAPSLLYKGSRDTYAFPKMLECVAGKSGLLFALKEGHTHRFGTFIDGPITPPAEPTENNGYYVPVFFFSLSGAYDTPTKIEIPEEKQKVTVAGTQGVVKNDRDEPRANVAIARGCLWLGCAKPGPAADISSCVQWIEGDCLPAGYEGDMDDDGDGFLGQSLDLTASEIEIWHIQQVQGGWAGGLMAARHVEDGSWSR
ncbi:unnamed protein product [Vitrella brassicaformis CCMP3155]|uniref:TLDc domain-containing protein n=1 Tax=Vitrella brassicaformis (strain CCMP3155) TaxID=1169540 RepID=A0A0G4EHL5_VITBC|nr:unnamed protein product [Vitrella brassicaformis CCMP3155]|eukprot:CEL95982.1 unnamed protein product [Vitrella brassicaformis CCMP3155]